MIEEVLQWIKQISLQRPELSGFAVCPFAEASSFEIIESSICDVSPVEGVDVAIFIVEPYLSSEILRDYRALYNGLYPEYEFLEDGMDESTFLRGIQTNFGKANLMLVQNKSHLNKMREYLGKTEYYTHWDPDIIKQIQRP